MRVVFLGTPDFAVPALEALHIAGHDIACVYTQPPRPAGRGQKPRPSPVEARATDMGLPIRQPVNFRDAATLDEFAAWDTDCAVVVAYGLLLPEAALNAPKHGCLNIHASLLPRWRGAAPIQRAIMAGDPETGVAIMQMEKGLDTGPVLWYERLRIGASETAGALHDRLAALGADAIVATLARLDQLVPVPQPEDGVTYAAKINKAEAQIDWSKSAEEIVRQINGLSPFPGAWTEWDGARVKLLQARLAALASADNAMAGERLPAEGLCIACRSGALEVLQMQKAGRAAQTAEAFLRGTPIAVGGRLG